MTRADVLVRLEQHQVDLGREEAAEGDRGGDVDAHAHTRDLNLQRRQPSARLYMLKHRKTRREARVCVYAGRRRARARDLRGTDLVVVVGAEVDGHEGQPDDARRVHGEADVLGLIEVLRYLAGLERVQGAHEDQEHVVDQGHHQRERGHAASKHRGQRIRMDLRGVRRLDHQPHDSADQLHCGDPCTNGSHVIQDQAPRTLEVTVCIVNRITNGNVREEDL